MDSINFLGKPDFPNSTQTMDMLQGMARLAGALAWLGGANYILSGCTETGGEVTGGIVVIDGEPYKFAGGPKKDRITIRRTHETLSAFGVEYPQARTRREAVFSDKGEYAWADLERVPTNFDLMALFKSIKGDAPGTVKMWAGTPAKIPKEYILCDGRDLLITDYPELYSNIGLQYGGNEESFKIPDLRGKFIVGFDSADKDYKEIGKTGGQKEVTLTEKQLPPHKHIVPWGENLNTSWQPEWGWPDEYFNKSRGYKAETDNDNTWPYTSPTGGGEPHENRPPYFTLAYIIKVK